jgi:serine/threonine protein kinase
MGEVWRARDTRLQRSVALKILPEAFARDEQSRQRFEREARTVSQLNHPHICTLHDVGEEDGQHFLVMELLEGESLADRLSRGPLPLHEVLRFGAQVAQALDAAHRSGITHRDLKPGNVMLTRSGAKLLDFGLAKAGPDSPAAVSSFTSLPTEARPLTEQGTILGTFQYMAPEQLEGQEADARTDIFALGTLLFEMATGKRAFEGASKTSLIAAIVSSQPAPVSSLQPTTPPALDHVIRKCLEKDPEDRWQSAHDVASELSWVSQAGSQAGVAAPLSLRRKTRERLAWALAALGALATATVLTVHLREPAAEARPTLTQILPPKDTTFQISGGNAVTTLTVSPDGRLVTFLAKGEDGQARLWLRPLDSLDAHPTPSTWRASGLRSGGCC